MPKTTTTRTITTTKAKPVLNSDAGGESDDIDDAEDKENREGNPIERKYLDKIRDATLKG